MWWANVALLRDSESEAGGEGKNQTNKFIKIGRKTFIFEPASVFMYANKNSRSHCQTILHIHISLVPHDTSTRIARVEFWCLCLCSSQMVDGRALFIWFLIYLLFVLWLPFENFVQNEWNYWHFLVASSPADIQAQKAQHELNSILFTVNRCVEIMCTLCARTRARSWPLIFPNFRVSLISNFSAIFNTNDCVRPNFKIHSKKKF